MVLVIGKAYQFIVPDRELRADAEALRILNGARMVCAYINDAGRFARFTVVSQPHLDRWTSIGHTEEVTLHRSGSLPYIVEVEVEEVENDTEIIGTAFAKGLKT